MNELNRYKLMYGVDLDDNNTMSVTKEDPLIVSLEPYFAHYLLDKTGIKTRKKRHIKKALKWSINKLLRDAANQIIEEHKNG